MEDYPCPSIMPLDECCICLEQPVMVLVRIEQESFPFCGKCELRSTFLQRGQLRGWPALRIEGITGKYAIDDTPQGWVFTSLFGTNERIIELLDALDEHEESIRLAS